VEILIAGMDDVIQEMDYINSSGGPEAIRRCLFAYPDVETASRKGSRSRSMFF
jgi:hypothetical protein